MPVKLKSIFLGIKFIQKVENVKKGFMEFEQNLKKIESLVFDNEEENNKESTDNNGKKILT